MSCTLSAWVLSVCSTVKSSVPNWMASCGNSAQVRATDFGPHRKVGAAVFICWVALVRYCMSLLGGEQRPDLLTQVIPTPLEQLEPSLLAWQGRLKPRSSSKLFFKIRNWCHPMEIFPRPIRSGSLCFFFGSQAASDLEDTGSS